MVPKVLAFRGVRAGSGSRPIMSMNCRLREERRPSQDPRAAWLPRNSADCFSALTLRCASSFIGSRGSLTPDRSRGARAEPALDHGLLAAVELDAVRPVNPEVPEETAASAAEREEGHRRRDSGVDPD